MFTYLQRLAVIQETALDVQLVCAGHLNGWQASVGQSFTRSRDETGVA